MPGKDKLVRDRAAIDRVIRESRICHLSCCLEDRPYLIPLSFGYDGQAVYLHSAPTGKKITIFEANPRVCLAFVSRAELKADPGQACEWSFAYSSVIAEGTICEVRDPEEKAQALNRVMEGYSGREWPFPEKTLARTRVWKVVLENPTAKISPSKE